MQTTNNQKKREGETVNSLDVQLLATLVVAIMAISGCVSIDQFGQEDVSSPESNSIDPDAYKSEGESDQAASHEESTVTESSESDADLSNNVTTSETEESPANSSDEFQDPHGIGIRIDDVQVTNITFMSAEIIWQVSIRDDMDMDYWEFVVELEPANGSTFQRYNILAQPNGQYMAKLDFLDQDSFHAYIQVFHRSQPTIEYVLANTSFETIHTGLILKDATFTIGPVHGYGDACLEMSWEVRGAEPLRSWYTKKYSPNDNQLPPPLAQNQGIKGFIFCGLFPDSPVWLWAYATSGNQTVESQKILMRTPVDEKSKFTNMAIDYFGGNGTEGPIEAKVSWEYNGQLSCDPHLFSAVVNTEGWNTHTNSSPQISHSQGDCQFRIHPLSPNTQYFMYLRARERENGQLISSNQYQFKTPA